MSETAPHPDLAAMAAYGAFALSAADRLGEMPPWEALPPEARADWRAVADAVQMMTTHLAEDGWDAARDRTDNEVLLAAAYGTCEECGAPRTVRTWARDGGVCSELVCLNGHVAEGGSR